MFPLRRASLALAAAGVAALILTPAVAGHAAPAPTPTRVRAVAPDPAAPHRGTVPAIRGTAARTRMADAAADFRAAHRGLIPGTGHDTAPSLAAQIHPAQGTSLTNVSGTGGVVATQSFSPTLTVARSSTTIYTPTVYPAGGSCIEVTTVYRTGTRSVSVWDWCNAITFVVSVPIDATFQSRYASGGFYSTEVLRTSSSPNTWVAYLYNYATATWETLYTSSGSTQAGTSGWDVYELYSDVDGSGTSYACTDMAGTTFEARSIRQYINGSWVNAAPGNAGTAYDQPHDNFKCPDMTYQMVTQYSNWRAVG